MCMEEFVSLCAIAFLTFFCIIYKKKCWKFIVKKSCRSVNKAKMRCLYGSPSTPIENLPIELKEKVVKKII